jgi:hypothetical protein
LVVVAVGRLDAVAGLLTAAEVLLFHETGDPQRRVGAAAKRATNKVKVDWGDHEVRGSRKTSVIEIDESLAQAGMSRRSQAHANESCSQCFFPVRYQLTSANLFSGALLGPLDNLRPGFFSGPNDVQQPHLPSASYQFPVFIVRLCSFC